MDTRRSQAGHSEFQKFERQAVEALWTQFKDPKVNWKGIIKRLYITLKSSLGSVF